LSSRNPKSTQLATGSEWTSALELAGTWDFKEIRSLAIRKLPALTTPDDRIVLVHKYGISAYQKHCVREERLTEEEGHRFDVQDVLRIGSARQAMMSKGPERNGSDRVALIMEICDQHERMLDLPAIMPSANTLASSSLIAAPPTITALAPTGTTEDVMISDPPSYSSARADVVSSAQEAKITASPVAPIIAAAIRKA
jgi:hypothetical protein